MTAGQKKKRGRPRKEGVEREGSGRIRRAKGSCHAPKEPADAAPLAVRARMNGISIAEAKDQKAGSFIGILRIYGQRDARDPNGITQEQFEALTNYGKLHQDYRRAIAAPGAGIASEGSGSGGTEISHGYIRWCSRIREQHAEVKAAIMDAQCVHRNDHILGALQYCVVEDMRMWHLVGALRLAANALAVHFGRVA